MNLNTYHLSDDRIYVKRNVIPFSAQALFGKKSTVELQEYMDTLKTFKGEEVISRFELQPAYDVVDGNLRGNIVQYSLETADEFATRLRGLPEAKEADRKKFGAQMSALTWAPDYLEPASRMGQPYWNDHNGAKF